MCIYIICRITIKKYNKMFLHIIILGVVWEITKDQWPKHKALCRWLTHTATSVTSRVTSCSSSGYL